MAKTTGPLMSMSASGTVGKTITFSIWKGISYVRQRVIPKNPKSVAQKIARSALGTIAKACATVLTITADTAAIPKGSPFFTAGVATAPSGNSWISYLQKILNNQFAALVIAYAVPLTSAPEFEITAPTLGLAGYVDKSGTTQTAGFQLFLLATYAVDNLAYTGFAAGIDAATQSEVTAFGVWAHDTTP